MEFSPRFRQLASGIFNNGDSDNDTKLNESNVALEYNNVYTKSLVVDLSENIVEIPVLARRHYEQEIEAHLDLPDRVLTQKIVLPLFTNTYPQNRRTFDSIFAQMNAIPYGARLQKFITNKGEVYYGSRGLLLDENMEPLMLCTVAARHTKMFWDRVEKDALEYFRPICHISPRVFGTRSTKLMEKSIIKKLIPFYSSNNIYFPSGYIRITSNADNTVCQVVIDKFDKFFIEPVKPTPSTCNNEILNQCLVDNIEDIIQELVL